MSAPRLEDGDPSGQAANPDSKGPNTFLTPREMTTSSDRSPAEDSASGSSMARSSTTTSSGSIAASASMSPTTQQQGQEEEESESSEDDAPSASQSWRNSLGLGAGSHTQMQRSFLDSLGLGQGPKSTEARMGDEAIKRVAQLIKSGKARRIVVLTGAGISTSAGIPDFRSPNTGLYSNLQELNLPNPEAVFELEYFRSNPKPFWTLAKELYPGRHYPTAAHYFINLLSQKCLLERCFSQNIDTLEQLAGLDPSEIIEAHGSFATAHCLTCRAEASTEHVLKSGVRRGEIVKCAEEGCDGLVKPDIVFFGEGLPKRFFDTLPSMSMCDLCIVIGTSLTVQPFARLPSYVGEKVPRLLINREPVGPFTSLAGSGQSNRDAVLAQLLAGVTIVSRPEDMFYKGDADDGVRRLADELGWREELEEMISKGNKDLEAKWEERAKLSGAELDNAEQSAGVKGDGDVAEKTAEKLALGTASAMTGGEEQKVRTGYRAGNTTFPASAPLEGEADESKVPLDEIQAFQRLIQGDLKRRRQDSDQSQA